MKKLILISMTVLLLAGVCYAFVPLSATAKVAETKKASVQSPELASTAKVVVEEKLMGNPPPPPPQDRKPPPDKKPPPPPPGKGNGCGGQKPPNMRDAIEDIIGAIRHRLALIERLRHAILNHLKQMGDRREERREKIEDDKSKDQDNHDKKSDNGDDKNKDKDNNDKKDDNGDDKDKGEENDKGEGDKHDPCACKPKGPPPPPPKGPIFEKLRHMMHRLDALLDQLARLRHQLDRLRRLREELKDRREDRREFFKKCLCPPPPGDEDKKGEEDKDKDNGNGNGEDKGNDQEKDKDNHDKKDDNGDDKGVDNSGRHHHIGPEDRGWNDRNNGNDRPGNERGDRGGAGDAERPVPMGERP